MVRIFTVALVLLAIAAPAVGQEIDRRQGRADIGGIQLAYRILGPREAEALLFIQGVGGVIPAEPDPLSTALAEEGFRVILFDNRDAGASTHLPEAGMPDFAAIQEALAAGETPSVPYTIDDMEDDAVGLLDALGIERAHIVGGSLGGMIAQTVAADHPQRTASLTLISSTTGNPALPRGMPPGGGEPMDAATARQGAAAAAAGDLRERSTAIAAETVVIHGDRDRLFPVAHGRDLAATIPGARLVVVPDMGHVPEEEHLATIVEAIRSVAGRALDDHRKAGREP